MRVSLTPNAKAFLAEQGARDLTVSSLVFSSCCSGPLAPEVKPGPPRTQTVLPGLKPAI